LREKSLKYIPISLIMPGRNQPRDILGDLRELAESIREKGIIEPLIVRKKGDKYEIISGERRYRAALMVGLTQLPCIEMDVDDREAMEIALIENIQRKDLTPFEIAEGYRALVTLYGYTHQELARRIGKARSTVTEMIEIANIPPRIKNLCMELGITASSVLLLIARQRDEEAMEELARKIAAENLSREEARRLARRRGPRRKSIKFADEEGGFEVNIRVNPEVGRDHLVNFLRKLLEKIENGEIDLK